MTILSRKLDRYGINMIENVQRLFGKEFTHSWLRDTTANNEKVVKHHLETAFDKECVVCKSQVTAMNYMYKNLLEQANKEYDKIKQTIHNQVSNIVKNEMINLGDFNYFTAHAANKDGKDWVEIITFRELIPFRRRPPGGIFYMDMAYGAGKSNFSANADFDIPRRHALNPFAAYLPNQSLENTIKEVTNKIFNQNIKKLYQIYSHIFKQLIINGLFSLWLTSDKVVAVLKPQMYFNNQEQLHYNGDGAVVWEDGSKYYFLNGINVPEEIAITPHRLLNPKLLLTETNAEIRREIVRKIGIERVCDELNAYTKDTYGDYELLLLDIGDRRQRPYLKMKNPSLGVYVIEGVHPQCNTVLQALAWRNGEVDLPQVLT